ncbi:MAG: cytochrome c [Desulfuromonadaceae bacterium]|nr:cytochrome c [Geobacteraceae bacterium]
MSKNNLRYSVQTLAVGVFIATSFLVGGCDTDQSRELTPQQQLLRSGKELFSQKCASCHGARGSGMGSRNGPALNGENYRYGNEREAVLKSIHDGREDGMPAFSSVLTQTQTEALTEYVLYLQR